MRINILSSAIAGMALTVALPAIAQTTSTPGQTPPGQTTPGTTTTAPAPDPMTQPATTPDPAPSATTPAPDTATTTPPADTMTTDGAATDPADTGKKHKKKKH